MDWASGKYPPWNPSDIPKVKLPYFEVLNFFIVHFHFIFWSKLKGTPKIRKAFFLSVKNVLTIMLLLSPK